LALEVVPVHSTAPTAKSRVTTGNAIVAHHSGVAGSCVEH
jgi:hypothetical protein